MALVQLNIPTDMRTFRHREVTVWPILCCTWVSLLPGHHAQDRHLRLVRAGVRDGPGCPPDEAHLHCRSYDAQTLQQQKTFMAAL